MEMENLLSNLRLRLSIKKDNHARLIKLWNDEEKAISEGRIMELEAVIAYVSLLVAKEKLSDN